MIPLYPSITFPVIAHNKSKHLYTSHFLDSLINITKTRSRSTFNTWFSTNIISDRVHCDPLSCVTSGSRCHTADYLKETKNAEDNSVPCPMCSLSKPPTPWVHRDLPPLPSQWCSALSPIYSQDPLLCMGINKKAGVVCQETS